MSEAQHQPGRWWREPQVLWLTGLVVACYFLRLGALELRGEETRRARVAVVMLETGDWIVPRMQERLYFSRPPLGNWLNAICGSVRGSVDNVAVRLPSVLAVLLTTLLIYAYSRGFLSRFGAFTAAVAYPTMVQVLQIGRLGETEAVFTLVTASSLLVWHHGYTKGWRPWVMWTGGYSLAALAGLTKGPQGPIYFVVPVVCWLLYRRDWRTLFSRGHAAGVLAFAVVLGSWQVPYFLQTDWESSQRMWVKQASDRFLRKEWRELFAHMLVYPWEVLACMMPWSLCGLQLLRPDFHRQTSAFASRKQFLAICLITTFPSVWLAATAEPRYFMPLYPIAAVICGIVIEYLLRPDAGRLSNVCWSLFLRGCGLAGAGAAIFLLACHLSDSPRLRAIAPSAGMTWAFVAVAMAVGGALFRVARSTDLRQHAVAVALIGGLIGFGVAGMSVEGMRARQLDMGPAVAEVRSRLPADVRLISFGQVDHSFLYYYRETIPRYRVSSAASRKNVDWFCIQRHRGNQPQLPFAWETIATVPVDSDRDRTGRNAVLIGRRTGPVEVAAGRSEADPGAQNSTRVR